MDEEILAMIDTILRSNHNGEEPPESKKKDPRVLKVDNNINTYTRSEFDDQHYLWIKSCAAFKLSNQVVKEIELSGLTSTP